MTISLSNDNPRSPQLQLLNESPWLIIVTPDFMLIFLLLVGSWQGSSETAVTWPWKNMMVITFKDQLQMPLKTTLNSMWKLNLSIERAKMKNKVNLYFSFKLHVLNIFNMIFLHVLGYPPSITVKGLSHNFLSPITCTGHLQMQEISE